MLARIVVLLIGVSVAYGASIMATGPMMPDLGCSMFDVVQPNPNLMPSSDNTYYYVYGTDANYGFSSGEIYTNSLGTFMNVADGEGFLFWNIPSGTQSQWSPAIGTLYVVINLYSNAARTHLVGSGNFTSTDFFAHNFTDPEAPHGWVIAVGGNVTLTYTLTSGFQSPNTGGGFSTTVWQSRSINLVFPPNKNMWPTKETFTNRYFTRADAATFSAPLFDTDGSQTFWQSGTHMTPYTANYDAVIQLWGSNGFSLTSQAYTNPNVGVDVAWGLTCSGGPPSIHIVPPPCPTVPDCTGCTTQATVSGACSQATATTQADCLTFTVDDTLACTPATGSVQV